ncbi:hypothetical protein [Helicobacter sp. NHP22-001]|uniref:hypothetical protein n=1 Tax=Helicobacter sp. NHP22-001 TaxID=3040202 RepID=UPI002553023F|nr:hypothetical protein [Helicobacter sp. NHP22-001]
MSAKTYLWAVFGFMLLGFGSVMLFNYIMDPFQQFRKATMYGVDFTGGDERMLIAGMARTYDYDSILTGSSTEEKFSIDLLSSILHLKKPLKFVMAGETSYDLYRALRLAFAVHKNIKTVVYAINPLALMPNYNQADLEMVGNISFSFPDYLYRTDNRSTQLLTYLFSSRVSEKSLFYWHSIRDHKDRRGPCSHYNTMFAPYCKPGKADLKNVISDYLNFSKPSSWTQQILFSRQVVLQETQKHLESLIKSHPKTHFIFYYVPHSVLYYYVYKAKNTPFKDSLEEMFLQTPQAVSLRLLNYPNVELHDLRTMPMVSNLNAYNDPTHFDFGYSDVVLEAIASKKYQLNPSNVSTYTDALRKLILDYHIPKALSNQLLERKKSF